MPALQKKPTVLRHCNQMPPQAAKTDPDGLDPDLMAISERISADAVFLFITPISPKATRKLKRLVCYALAEVHPKNASTRPIVLQLRGITDYAESPENHIYRVLKAGRQWTGIVSQVSEGCDWQAALIGYLKGTT